MSTAWLRKLSLALVPMKMLGKWTIKMATAATITSQILSMSLAPRITSARTQVVRGAAVDPHYRSP